MSSIICPQCGAKRPLESATTTTCPTCGMFPLPTSRPQVGRYIAVVGLFLLAMFLGILALKWFGVNLG